MFGKKRNVGYNKSMKADVVIIGGGPAGLSAGIFACRAGLNVVLIEKLVAGGQASVPFKIANYPGFKEISGPDLAENLRSHAESAGLKIVYDEVVSLDKTKSGFSVSAKKESFQAKKVIIACGCETKTLNLDGEKELTGKGVSYCASCDGGFFKGMPVAVIGGGDTAIGDVDYLVKLASKVYLINRSEKFRAGERELARIKKYKNLEIITDATVKKLHGKDCLEKIDISVAGKKRQLNVKAIFVAIGAEPKLDFINFGIDTDRQGYIEVDSDMQTSEKNLFACGDIISKDFRQIVIACAEGAIAGNACVGVR